MKARQYDSELSLLMIDVDHIKLFNDSYGHPEGDVCLTGTKPDDGIALAS
jgi:diguanylate cyclase (GGDEF)-like protein